MNYKGAYKSILSFVYDIKTLNKLYEEKKPYIDYNFSISRAIPYYVTTHEIKNKITNNTMKDIKNDYRNYLKSKNNKILEIDNDSNSEEKNFYLEKDINSNNDYSFKINTNSSDSSDLINIDINNEHINNNNGGSDNSSDNNINKDSKHKKIIDGKKFS